MWPLLALLACGPRPAPEPAAEPAPPPTPRLVVLVVIDQFPIALVDMEKDQWTDGFARLRADDAWVGTAQYAHASTLTCPGHATLSTGAGPRGHGIVGNNWIERGESKYCGDVGNLRADTLADRVVEAGGQVASLSLKDRGALMLGGRSPAVSIWYDKKAGTWNEGAPTWASVDPIEQALVTAWEPLKPEWYATLFPDEQGHEELIEELGPTFPHGPAGKEAPAVFAVLPASGTVLTDLALQAVSELDLGADDQPDLLTISYSHADAVGHTYTPQSWEVLDTFLRLDQDLGRLLTSLDERLGPDGYAIALTSDHGVADGTSKRIPVEPLMAAVTDGIAEAGLEGEPKFADNQLYLPAGSDEARKAAARKIAADLTAIDGVFGAFAWRVDPVPDDARERDRILASLDEERGGDIYLVLEPSTLIGSETGTTHGSPWEHDTIVPLMMRGPGLTPATGRSVDARAIAPTLASWMGIEAPKNAEVDAFDR